MNFKDEIVRVLQEDQHKEINSPKDVYDVLIEEGIEINYESVEQIILKMDQDDELYDVRPYKKIKNLHGIRFGRPETIFFK